MFRRVKSREFMWPMYKTISYGMAHKWRKVDFAILNYLSAVDFSYYAT
jgi:hypothetical protein